MIRAGIQICEFHCRRDREKNMCIYILLSAKISWKISVFQNPILCRSPGGIWIFAGSCGAAVCGSRGATVTDCGPADLGTVITTVLPGVVAWFTWLRAGFVTCGWPLALTLPGVDTLATTMTEGEEVCLTVTVEEAGWWLWPVGRTLGGTETETAAVCGGCTAVMGPHLDGTWNIWTGTEVSPSPAPPLDSSFWASITTLFVAMIISEWQNNVISHRYHP